MMTLRQSVRSLLGLLTLVGLSGIAGDAEAAAVQRTSCTVKYISYDTPSATTARFTVVADCTQATNVSYVVHTGFACTPAALNTSKESMSNFRAMVQAAMLAGKKINITYDNATGGGCVNGIYDIGMLP